MNCFFVIIINKKKEINMENLKKEYEKSIGCKKIKLGLKLKGINLTKKS